MREKLLGLEEKLENEIEDSDDLRRKLQTALDSESLQPPAPELLIRRRAIRGGRQWRLLPGRSG